MSVGILVVGVVLIVAGLIAIVMVPKPVPPAVDPKAESVIGDIKDVLAELNTLLDKFDKRLRLGVLLITFGVGLVGLAGFIEAKEAMDEAKDAVEATATLFLRTR